MALVHNHQIKEVRRELPVDILFFLVAGYGLVQREINLVTLIDLTMRYLAHGRAERFEVVDARLINQDVAVSQVQDPLLRPGFPEPPDDLERGIGFPRSRGHDQENTVLPLFNRLDRSVNSDPLVITRFFAAAVGVVILRDDLLLLAGQPFPRAIPLPQFIRRGEGIEWQFLFYWAGSHRAIMAMEGISVRAEHEGNIE